MMKTPRLSQSLQMNVDFDATFAITVSEPRVRDPDFPRSTQSPFERKQDMKHTTPPLDYSGLPNTDAEFQKYKDARTEGYSIMKALIELKSEAGIHDLAQLEQVIQEHLVSFPKLNETEHRYLRLAFVPVRQRPIMTGLSGDSSLPVLRAKSCEIITSQFSS